jgi:hypothetical protein
VTLAGTHAGEQTAAALVLATTAGGLAAIIVSRLAAGRGAATLAAEQAGGRFLLSAHHGETNQGHQHGDRRQHDTIHLKLLPRSKREKQNAR